MLLTYDVNTKTKEGQQRLSKISKTCENYGIRVQDSVFELNLDNGKYLKLQNELEKIINPEEDSIRFYKMKNKQVDILGKQCKLEYSKDNGFFI